MTKFPPSPPILSGPSSNRNRKATVNGDQFPPSHVTYTGHKTQCPGDLDGLTTPHSLDSCIRYRESSPFPT